MVLGVWPFLTLYQRLVHIIQKFGITHFIINISSSCYISNVTLPYPKVLPSWKSQLIAGLIMNNIYGQQKFMVSIYDFLKTLTIKVWRMSRHVGALRLDIDFKTWSSSSTSELYLIRIRLWNLFKVALTVLAVWQTVLEWNVVSSRVFWLLSPSRKDCRLKKGPL